MLIFASKSMLYAEGACSYAREALQYAREAQFYAKGMQLYTGEAQDRMFVVAPKLCLQGAWAMHTLHSDKFNRLEFGLQSRYLDLE